jgi:integrase
MLGLAAGDWELRSDNPCIGIKRFPEKSRERFYSPEELTRIGTALTVAERDGTELPAFILLVRLLANTGMRLGEALGLQWRDIDLAEGAIRLGDAKAGARTVHLGADTIALLANVEGKTGWLFPGSTPDAPLSPASVGRAWDRIRIAATLSDGRLHDLRHTVGTYAALSGANAFAIRDLLGHKTLAMTNRYVERAADMVRNTANSVSARVTSAMATAPADDRQEAEVIPLKLSRKAN